MMVLKQWLQQYSWVLASCGPPGFESNHSNYQTGWSNHGNLGLVISPINGRWLIISEHKDWPSAWWPSNYEAKQLDVVILQYLDNGRLEQAIYSRSLVTLKILVFLSGHPGDLLENQVRLVKKYNSKKHHFGHFSALLKVKMTGKLLYRLSGLFQNFILKMVFSTN